mgnify:FL=1
MGKEHGKFTGWYDNGVKEFERFFTEGLEDGKSTKWDKKGKIISEQYYRNGKLEP